MVGFIMKVAATIRLSTNQTMLEKYEGNTSEQARVKYFQAVLPENYGVFALLRLVFFFTFH